MKNWSFCLVMIKKYFFSALVFDQQMLGFSLSSEAIRGLYCHLCSLNFPTPLNWSGCWDITKTWLSLFVGPFLILVGIPQRLFLVDILVKILEPVCLLVIEGYLSCLSTRVGFFLLQSPLTSVILLLLLLLLLVMLFTKIWLFTTVIFY